MDENKSKYVFIVNEDEQVIHTLVQDFLSAYGFVQKTKDNETYYVHKNRYYGKQFFEYCIEGNKVIVWAYVGSYNNPSPLSYSYFEAAESGNYYDKLIKLFNKFLGMNGNMTQEQTSAVNAFYKQHKQFMEGVDKARGINVIMAFVLSIFLFVLSLLAKQIGTMTLIGSWIQVVLAIGGLKSSKRILAIVTLVVTVLNVIVYIFI